MTDMKKLLFLLFALLALTSWSTSVEVTYNYSKSSTLQAMGFTPSEYQQSPEGEINLIRNKVLSDQYATMTYEHFGFYYASSVGYFLNLLYAGTSNTEWGENWVGKISWDTHKSTYAITKIVVESTSDNAAERVVITGGNNGSTTSGAFTSCDIIRPGEVSVTGENAVILKITVSYANFDLNGDGKVNPDDMNAMVYCIFRGNDHDPAYDFNGDGIADAYDMNQICSYLWSNPMNLDVTPYIGLGNVNGNAIVNQRDYELIYNFATKYENVDNDWACNDEAYDVNGDGKCDFWDYYIVYLLVQQGYTTPIPTGNITFEDASTKAACVALFDTNGDGELSYREASAVTPSQLGTNLAGSTNLKHFDEFQYFTGITYLPEGCFRSADSLLTITLPNDIESVSKSAFRLCSNLQRVTLPESIKSIRDYAFFCCFNLTTINFPSMLDSIGFYSFCECNSLANIDYTENSIRTVGAFAFSNCYHLTSFPFENVERIDEKAFRNTGLTEVTTNARHIGTGAFSTNRPITVTLLRNHFENINSQNTDYQEGLHMPITSASPAQGTQVRVPCIIFHEAYSATTEARECLHPYITLNKYVKTNAVAFSCEVPVVLPEGSKIFIVTDMDHTDGQKQAFSRYMPGNVVPANTGVVIRLPNRELNTDQFWFFTADPNATATGDYSDNILIAATGVEQYIPEYGIICCIWDPKYNNNEYQYGWLSTLDFWDGGGCSSFLAFNRLGMSGFSGAWYNMDLTTPEDIYDLNGDGKADPDDLNEWLMGYNDVVPERNYNPVLDFNQDGIVDLEDYYDLRTYLSSNPMNLDVTPYIGLGDVNGNGIINGTDYQLIEDFARKYENIQDGWVCDDPAYDVNVDGKCDSWDYFIVYFLVKQGHTTPLGKLGDMNRDGMVDVSDVNAIINIMLGKTQAISYPGHADVNSDNAVDVSDVNKVINIMLGKEAGGTQPGPEPVTVTYDFTTAASLQAMGFSASEINVPMESKEMNDPYATMAYRHFIFQESDYTDYCMYFYSWLECGQLGWNQQGGRIDWTPKNGRKIIEVVVEAADEDALQYVYVGNYVVSWSSSTSDYEPVTTYNFSEGGASSIYVEGGWACINKITVTYQ